MPNSNQTITPSRLYLIDSMSILFQSFYAIRGLTNKDGLPTNAIFGFARKILSIIKEYQPSHIAAVFESTTPTFRHELYPEYKANRVAAPDEFKVQIPHVFRLLDAMGIPHVFRDGFEADDVIGTLSRMASESGIEVLIVSADKDLFQLINDRVKMLRTATKDLELFDAAKVKEKMGVGPEQIIDYLAMVGDASDNIPGIPKIGPKTAVALLERFQSLDALYANLDQLTSDKQRAQIEENRDKAMLSQKLARVELDIDLDWSPDALRCEPRAATPELLALYHELGFVSLEREALALLKQSGEAPSPSVASTTVVTGNESTQAVPGSASTHTAAAPNPPADPGLRTECATVVTEKQLRALAAEIKKAGRFAFDTETTAIDSMTANLVGISLSHRPGAGFYIPVGHAGFDSFGRQLELPLVREILNPLFADPKIERVAQNAKYDLRILRRHGFTVHSVAVDTMLASYLLDPDGRHGLKHLARAHLGVTMTEIVELIGGGKNSITMDQVEIDQAAPYACADADMTLRLADILVPELRQQGLNELFERIEMPLVEVLDAMESEGVALDVKSLEETGNRLRERLEGLTREIIDMAGCPFNIKSPQQVANVLFEKIGLKPGRKTKTGRSTGSDVLEDLETDHPLPRKILEFRRLDKLVSTYVEALPKMVNPETRRVHTSYNQFIAATGRLSSSDPNLQNIPVRSFEGREIRRAFLPNHPDWVFLAADYSQIELRVLAHMSGDEALLDAFRAGADIHARTASRVFNVPVEMVTEEMRDQSKTINFGVLYGMGAARLARQLEIPFKQARQFIDEYFAAFPRVRSWMDQTLDEARRTGYVSTLSGRRRYVPNLNSDNGNLRANAERVAINTPVQGSSADMIKIAMIALHREILKSGRRARMVLQVHDELVFSLPAEELEDFKPVARRLMEEALPLDAPVKVDMKSGRNWAEC
jgi:DNA polymerase-1